MASVIIVRMIAIMYWASTVRQIWGAQPDRLA